MSSQRAGAGLAVVLLHGQPGSAADWDLVRPHLSGLRLLVPDRPGYDGTPAGGFGPNADALLRLLEAEGIDRAVLVGHSWGGGVALRAALDAPARVASLCLLGSVGSADAITGTDRLLAVRAVGRAHARFMHIAGRRMAPVLAASTGSRLDADQLTALGDTLETWSRTGAWRAYLVEQRAFVREAPALARQLGDVHAPAIVAIGARDRSVSPRVQHDLADRLPHSEVMAVDSGHLMTLEAPAQVAAAIYRAVALAGHVS